MKTVKEVFGFDKDTGEYLGVEYARLCPVTRKEWHYPAHTTEVSPPAHRQGFARVFSDGKWEFIEDNRGKERFVKETGQTAGVVNYLGQVSDDFTFIAPEFEYPKWDAEKAGWIEDPEKTEAARQEKAAASNETLQRIADITQAVYGDKTDYGGERAKEYPPIGDQLDAIWKELNYRRLKGDELTQEADDMLGKILAVKQKYPKTHGGD